MSYQALLFCPDDKTARVVTQVLTELDFTVEPCNEPFAAVKKLMAQHFDAIVVDCDNEQNAALLFKSARNSGSNQTSLAVAVVEGQAGVAKAFRIGANLVLTKPINVEQSKGTLRVARGLLRKADSGKPAGTPLTEAKAPLPPVFEAPRPLAPAPAPTKPLTTAFTAPAPPAPPAPAASSDTLFERESDPEPKPEPAEAALLESMPAVVPEAKTPSASTPKEYPWQPVSKLAEPMASALRAAAEAAAKPSGSAGEIGAPDWGSAKQVATETQSVGLASPSSGSSQAAATAPAPVKHDLKIAAQSIKFETSAVSAPEEKPAPAPVMPPAAPRLEPPTFAALAVKDHEEESEEPQEGGKKAYVIIALVIIAVIFTAYMLYLKTHDSPAPVTTHPAPQQTTPSPQAQTPAPTSPAPAASNAEPAAQEIVLKTPKAQESASKKPFPDVTVTRFPDAHTSVPSTSSEVSAPAPAPEPVVVKHNAPAKALKVPEPDVAPPMVTAPADDKALANIAAVSPVSVAKPVASTLKVSQGVSQGLLVKRVQPIYPPQALQMRMEGTVLLQANITKDGKISNVKVLKGESILAKAAVDAVKQWTYNPYLLNGEPVEIQTQMSITFKLP